MKTTARKTQATRYLPQLLVGMAILGATTATTATANSSPPSVPPVLRVVNLTGISADVTIGGRAPKTAKPGEATPFLDVEPQSAVVARLGNMELRTTVTSAAPHVTLVIRPPGKLIEIGDDFSDVPIGQTSIRIIDAALHKRAYELQSNGSLIATLPPRPSSERSEWRSGWLVVKADSPLTVVQQGGAIVSEIPFQLEPAELATVYLAGGGESPLRITSTRDARGVAEPPIEPIQTGITFEQKTIFAPTMTFDPRLASTRINAPEIRMDAPMRAIRNVDGTLEVPGANEAGWYVHSPAPGEVGPAIVIGHVSFGRLPNGNPKPAVFANIDRLKTGAIVNITSQGRNLSYRVTGSAQWPKTELDRQRVFGPVIRSEIRLITCAGPIDRDTKRHVDNLVVFARLVA